MNDKAQCLRCGEMLNETLSELYAKKDKEDVKCPHCGHLNMQKIESYHTKTLEFVKINPNISCPACGKFIVHTGSHAIDVCNEPCLDCRMKKLKMDNVNHPSHYTQGGIETIDYLQAKLTKDEFIGYLKGNILKYMSRANLKNGTEDYKKAQWYINKLIEVMNNV